MNFCIKQWVFRLCKRGKDVCLSLQFLTNYSIVTILLKFGIGQTYWRTYVGKVVELFWSIWCISSHFWDYLRNSSKRLSWNMGFEEFERCPTMQRCTMCPVRNGNTDLNDFKNDFDFDDFLVIWLSKYLPTLQSWNNGIYDNHAKTTVIWVNFSFGHRESLQGQGIKNTFSKVCSTCLQEKRTPIKMKILPLNQSSLWNSNWMNIQERNIFIFFFFFDLSTFRFIDFYLLKIDKITKLLIDIFPSQFQYKKKKQIIYIVVVIIPSDQRNDNLN